MLLRFAIVAMIATIPVSAASRCEEKGLQMCGGRCVDVMTNPAHCGNCRTHCDGGKCKKGKCLGNPPTCHGTPCGKDCCKEGSVCQNNVCVPDQCPNGPSRCEDGQIISEICGSGEFGCLCFQTQSDGVQCLEIASGTSCEACTTDKDCHPKEYCITNLEACGCPAFCTFRKSIQECQNPSKTVLELLVKSLR